MINQVIHQRDQSHPFWGSRSPLSTLADAGLLIMASGRTAYALIVLGALIWVYATTAAIAFAAKPVLPKTGTNMFFIFLSSLLGSLYILLIVLTNPLLAMETSFLIILIPVSCIGSEICRRTESLDFKASFIHAGNESLLLGVLILGFALIREPLGFGSLSVPGGVRGILTIFGGEDGLFFPVRVLSLSSGALLILGYALALYRRVRGAAPVEEA
jgi:hypothetical protein